MLNEDRIKDIEKFFLRNSSHPALPELIKEFRALTAKLKDQEEKIWAVATILETMKALLYHDIQCSLPPITAWFEALDVRVKQALLKMGGVG